MTSFCDLVLTGGVVHTVDGTPQCASAVALKDGRIVAVGDDDSVRDLVGPRTEHVHLKGRTVLPGFQDGHVHASGAGLERRRCDLSGSHDKEEYLALVARYARAHPEVAWITVVGWSIDVFPGGVPTKEDLDRVVPDRPVFLSNRDHHAAWVNSAALERADVDARTADPADGRIERGAGDEPVGTLQEGAMALVERHVPRPTTEELVDGILEAQRYLHSLGITAWQEAIVGDYPVVPDCFEAFLAADRAGTLTAKVVGALWWSRDGGEGQLETLLARRERASSASHFRAGTVKFMQDGVCENFTASMLTPYLDRTGGETHNCGKSFFGADELAHYLTLVDTHGFQAHFHTIGDRAVRDALDAAEAARRQNGPSDNRHCAAHIQVVHPDDLPRFRRLQVIANGQPLWACNEPQMVDLTLPFLGPERSGRQYAFGSLARAGARLCFGSDWPVSTPDVLAQIHVAVNRTVPPGHLYGGGNAADVPLLPDERLDLETAVAAFTLGSAYLNHLDTETGSVRPGKIGDLVVLDRDLFSVPMDELALVEVDLTLADGEVVYARGST